MDVIKLIINFIWSVMNLSFPLGGFDVTLFQVFSFSVVVALFWKLIFGGAKKDG